MGANKTHSFELGAGLVGCRALVLLAHSVEFHPKLFEDNHWYRARLDGQRAIENLL